MTDTALSRDMMTVLAKHGVASAASAAGVASASSSPALTAGSQVASYIREIITGDQAFDEATLSRVATVLAKAGSTPG